MEFKNHNSGEKKNVNANEPIITESKYMSLVKSAGNPARGFAINYKAKFFYAVA